MASVNEVHMEQTEERFNMYPSEAKRQEIERNVEGVSIDFSPADHGEEPQHADYSHIISDPNNNEPY